MTVADYYLFVYTDFIKYRLDNLFVKYCYKYKIHKTRQLNFRDVVVSDLGEVFSYTCIYCLNKPQNADFITYLTSALRFQVRYSIVRQVRYYRHCKKDAVYYIRKFGRFFNGQIIDLRIKDPSEEFFRLSFEDFDFSPLNKNELKIIQLFFWRNLKIREIAKILKISESNVRQYKKRALKKLYKPNMKLLN